MKLATILMKSAVFAGYHGCVDIALTGEAPQHLKTYHSEIPTLISC